MYLLLEWVDVHWSIAMFVCCRAIICVYMFFIFPYIYIRNVPYIQTLFPFFQIAASKKKIAWAAISLCCVLSSGLRGSAARIVQKGFFRLQKTSFGTHETVVGLFFHTKPPLKKICGERNGFIFPTNFRAESL